MAAKGTARHRAAGASLMPRGHGGGERPIKTTGRANLPPRLESRYLAKLQSAHRLLKTKRDSMAVHHFPSIGAFVKACKAGQVPEDLVSPGALSRQIGLTRQAVHFAISEGRIDAWKVAGGYCFVRLAASKEFR